MSFDGSGDVAGVGRMILLRKIDCMHDLPFGIVSPIVVVCSWSEDLNTLDCKGGREAERCDDFVSFLWRERVLVHETDVRSEGRIIFGVKFFVESGADFIEVAGGVTPMNTCEVAITVYEEIFPICLPIWDTAACPIPQTLWMVPSPIYGHSTAFTEANPFLPKITFQERS